MLMRVDEVNGDYYVYFTREGLESAVTPDGFTALPHRYHPLDAPVHDGTLQFLCTNDSWVLGDPKSRGGIFFDRDDEGPIVRVHTSRMLELQRGDVPYVMTRYDGENKLFLMRDEYSA